MERSTYLSNRLKELFLDGKWIANTNYKAILSDLNWQDAVRKIGDLNSIAAITYHINYYLAGLVHMLHTAELTIRDQYSFDLPTINTESDWQDLVQTLERNATIFATQVAALSDETLDAVFVHPEYGNYQRNIEAVLEHSYYHLGQISLLKKLIRTSTTS